MSSSAACRTSLPMTSPTSAWADCRLGPAPAADGKPPLRVAPVRGDTRDTDERERPAMPIATPEIYAQMLDRAKEHGFAYPAINVTSSQTLNAALRGFADAESDGIVQ